MFEGFEDYGGSERKASFAEHALVFMLRGTTSTPCLTSLLKDVIRQVKLTGLKIMCTICDQGATNQATINSLRRETEQNCIRQGIDNRHCGFVIDDKAEHELRLCPKLTDFHVIPEKIKKIKVSCASQVFSQRVAAGMKCMSRLGAVAPHECTIDPEASQTAELLLFFDKLFDSVNGHDVRPQVGKELRHGVRNINPTCNSFVFSFKSLLINNFLSPHSAGSNCQAEDGSAGVLDTFKTFVTENAEISFMPPEVRTPIFQSSSILRKSSLLGQWTQAYVAGYVASKIFIKTKSCLQCRNLLISTNLSCDELIVSRSYYPGLLKTPSANFMKCFKSILHKITEAIPETIVLYGVKRCLA
ncbi:hypothetical protein ILUMI_15126 [Ignelater luminosus]|uniref:Transposable element P transposase-like GTP-binding insertion domain-containing protein n=1 Tax=Ignelater luminosus TaxID=2038154 RepID=A0A8K0CTJ4_IGNLU|nr:hypothetical protein ILUMI_15126 [Ignelater luminosus]